MPDVILCPCLIRFPFHIAGGAGEHAAAMPLAFLGHPPLDLLALPLLLGTGLCPRTPFLGAFGCVLASWRPLCERCFSAV